jgi:hypothetical protein
MRSGTTDCGLPHGRGREGDSRTLHPCEHGEEARMEVLYERCCGIDVHKSSVAACTVSILLQAVSAISFLSPGRSLLPPENPP